MGWRPTWVRAALVLGAILSNGLVLVAYGVAWILLPQEGATSTALEQRGRADAASLSGRPALTGRSRPWEPTSIEQAERFERIKLLIVGLAMLVGAVYLFAGTREWHADIRRLLPGAVILAGAAVALTQLDENERSRWFGTRATVWKGLLRLLVGVLLVTAGVTMIFLRQLQPGQVTTVLFSGAAVLVGLGMVLAPLGLRLWRDLESERALRVRETERAEITTHLHDSVLQTLALIQRRPDDPAEVRRLARAQERELRAWLYGGEEVREEQPSSLKEAVRRAVAEIEDKENLTISPIIVGDAPMDDASLALVQALREATSNAARHGKVGVSVYVECSETDGIEAFIRDRGPGIELAAIPADRFGVRRSIIDRMARNGGTGEVRNAAAGGTEVILRLPAASQETTE